MVSDRVLEEYQFLLSTNIESHTNNTKKAVYEECSQLAEKTKPKNAAFSFSPFILASGFSLDFYALYRDNLDK